MSGDWVPPSASDDGGPRWPEVSDGPGASGPPPPPPPGGSGAPPPPPAAPTPPPRTAGWSGGRLVPLRPLRLGEVLDSAFRLYRSTFTDVAVLVAITMGLVQAVAVTVQGPQPGLFDAAAATAIDPVELIVRSLAALAITTVSLLFIEPIVRGAVTSIALEEDRGGDSSWQAGLRVGLGLAGRLIVQGLLLLVIAVIGLVVVVVASIPFFLLAGVADSPILAVVAGLGFAAIAVVALCAYLAFFFLAVPVVVVEGAGAVDSLRRSARLVRPQWLRMTGIVVLTVLLLGTVSGVVTAPTLVLSGAVGVVAAIVLGVVSTVVVLPLQANIALLLYVDARVRVEGLDVGVLTAELDRA